MRARQVGILVHEDEAGTIKFEDDNVRKVCADLFSASAATIATLYHSLTTSTPLGCALSSQEWVMYLLHVWLRASSSSLR